MIVMCFKILYIISQKSSLKNKNIIYVRSTCYTVPYKIKQKLRQHANAVIQKFIKAVIAIWELPNNEIKIAVYRFS